MFTANTGSWIKASSEPHISNSKARYAVTVPIGSNGGQMVVAYQNEDELHDKFYSIAYRADRDVLDLPPAIHQVRS